MAIPSIVRRSLDSLQAVVMALVADWNQEHRPQGRHGNIHGLTQTLSLQPRVFAYNAATQSLTDAAYTTVTFTNTKLSVGAVPLWRIESPTLVMITEPGLYLCFARVTFATNAVGERATAITVLNEAGNTDDTPVINAVPAGAVAVNGVHAVEAQTLYTMRAGMSFRISAYQNSGGALNGGSATLAFANQVQVVKLC